MKSLRNNLPRLSLVPLAVAMALIVTHIQWGPVTSPLAQEPTSKTPTTSISQRFEQDVFLASEVAEWNQAETLTYSYFVPSLNTVIDLVESEGRLRRAVLVVDDIRDSTKSLALLTSGFLHFLLPEDQVEITLQIMAEGKETGGTDWDREIYMDGKKLITGVHLHDSALFFFIDIVFK